MARLPSLFVGHGSPFNLFTENPFTIAMKNYGQKFFQFHNPKAIVIISAHWLTHGTFITVDNNPKMIYDYYGFPKNFYDYVYPARGSSEIAKRISNFISNVITPSHDWGIDHAATIVLENILPTGETPVLELSIDFQQPPKYHLELGQKLAPLRSEGILFIGSGNLIHTFRELDYDINAPVFEWTQKLDDLHKQALDTHNIVDLLDINKMSLNKRGFQTFDHYLPMLYIIGMQDKNEQINFIYEGFQHGSISHRSFEIS